MFKTMKRSNTSDSFHSARDSSHSVQSASSSLKISSPLLSGTIPERALPRSNTVTIVVTKFPFKAENSKELTVGVGEALELIDRKANGWVLVKPIGRIREPGLIPESYVRIVDIKQLAEKSSSPVSTEPPSVESVQQNNTAESEMEEDINKEIENDYLKSHKQLATEVTMLTQRSNSNLTSLKESDTLPLSAHSGSSSLDSFNGLDYKSSTGPSKSSSSSTSMDSFDFKSSGFKQQLETLHDVEPLRIPERFSMRNRPVAGCVKNVSAYNKRYWYRVDLRMFNGERRFLCRYYQDFYNLHLAIIGRFLDQPDVIESLPELPEPLPRPDLATVESILLTRVQQLNVYLFRIVDNKMKLDYYDILDKWSTLKDTDFNLKEDQHLSTEEIDHTLNPDNINEQLIQTPIIEQITEFPSPSSTFRPSFVEKKRDRRPTLSIQTSTTPPLPSISTFKNTASSNSPVTSPHTVQSIISTTIKSPKLWQAIKYKRSHSDSSQYGMLSSVSNDNSAISSQFLTRTRNLSSPITPQSYQSPSAYTTTITTPTNTNMDPFATSKSSGSSEMKLKIIVGNDIIAVKFNNKIQKLQELRELVRKRLDVGEQEHVRLYYSRDDSHQFAPLLNDRDLQSAISQEKVLVMAEIHA